MSTKDLLAKLFDVEREAKAIVALAEAEAERLFDAAKASAQKKYTEAYDRALAEALAAREASEAAARDEYRRVLENYKERLECSRLDYQAFVAACEAALEEGL